MLFGKFDIDKDFQAINHILLLAKFCIYRCKLDKINLSIDVFIAKVRATYNLELFIAKKNDALLKHYTKRELFLSYLEPLSHDLYEQIAMFFNLYLLIFSLISVKEQFIRPFFHLYLIL